MKGYNFMLRHKQYSTPVRCISREMPMPVTKQHTLDYMGHGWGTCRRQFERLQGAERTRPVDQMDYADMRYLIGLIASQPDAGGCQALPG